MKPNIIIKLSILLVIWVLIFVPVFPGLYDSWFRSPNADNSYCALIPFISLYFIWTKRLEIRQSHISTSPLGLSILIGSLLIYLISYAGNIALIQRIMVVLSLNGLILYVSGKDTYKNMLFPLQFLFFMVPVPESVISIVSFPLQTYVTIISEKIILLCGIPVYREGHMLYFTQTQLEVAEACSGIRSISAMLMLAVIFAHNCRDSWYRRGIILMSSILIAFIANILRVSGTGILAYFFGAKIAKGFLHEFSGVVVFAFGFFMLLCVYSLLNCNWLED